VESLEPRQPLVSKGPRESLGNEEIVSGHLDEVAEFLSVQFQLDAVRRKPRQHADGSAASWAEVGLSAINGLGLLGLCIVVRPEDTFLQDEEP
jgi:hypothetical protein